MRLQRILNPKIFTEISNRFWQNILPAVLTLKLQLFSFRAMFRKFLSYGTVHSFEDPRGLVDPVALPSRDLMQVAALHKCLDGGVGCRAGHIEIGRASCRER